MQNKLFRKGLVVGVIFLFLGIAVQPITSIDIEQYSNSKQIEKIKQLNNDEAKDYLFETIIKIANNNDVKDFLDQYEDKIISSDFDFKGLFKMLLVKNPLLIFSILFTRPSMTYDFLEDIYNKGVEIVNIFGEDKVIEITKSSNFINKEIINELIYKTKDKKELSLKINELERLNSESKKDSPFQNLSVICAILIILDIFFILSLAICLILILMMPGKLLRGFLTTWFSIFFIQFYTVTYLIMLLKCIKIS